MWGCPQRRWPLMSPTKKMLKGIKAGDKVRVRVDSVKGKLMVTKLERST